MPGPDVHAPYRLLHPSRQVRTELRCLYRKLHRAIRRGIVRSCHDLADGGLWAALAESSLGGRLGASVDLDAVRTSGRCGREAERLLFCETPSRLLVSVRARDQARWMRAMSGAVLSRIGEVTAHEQVRVTAAGREVAAISLGEISRAWKAEGGGAP